MHAQTQSHARAHAHTFMHMHTHEDALTNAVTFSKLCPKVGLKLKNSKVLNQHAFKTILQLQMAMKNHVLQVVA